MSREINIEIILECGCGKQYRDVDCNGEQDVRNFMDTVRTGAEAEGWLCSDIEDHTGHDECPECKQQDPEVCPTCGSAPSCCAY